MKYLVLLSIVAVVILWIKHARRHAMRQPQSPSKPALDMTQCAYCQVHFPIKDASVGQSGLYCSVQHQSLAERK